MLTGSQLTTRVWDSDEVEDSSFERVFHEAVCGLDSHSAGQSKVDPDDKLEGLMLADRYRIERLLGRGGMGAVYCAQHVVTGRRVAVKWLRPDLRHNNDAVTRMTREARAAGRIHHPNVVNVLDAGVAAGRPFIAMELLAGESLDQRLQKGPLDLAPALELMQQIIQGVSAAHAHGIIHRDLKPANIFLCRDATSAVEVAKVLDFGISKLTVHEHEDLLATGQGEQIGTPMFMAPEQIRGDAVDERTDVYALSVTLHFMLTRRFPYEARTRGDLFAKILSSQPTAASEHRARLPRAIDTILLRGLDRDRTRRFASVTDLAAAIACLQSTSGRSRLFGRPWNKSVLLAALIVGLTCITHSTENGGTYAVSPEPQPPITAHAARVPVATAPKMILNVAADEMNSLAQRVDLDRPPAQPVPPDISVPNAPRPRKRATQSAEAAPQPPAAAQPQPELDKFMSW